MMECIDDEFTHRVGIDMDAFFKKPTKSALANKSALIEIEEAK